ncbi:Methyltransferase domain-containing protein [Chitinophaga sp. CF118]|uniref:class I SAM-dependent methyltransferase n=1 Tax=Chitinophaga sp. CF118 TaxID=1884367 RepID=UPI0008F39B25|nr:class I SAM-dependent methyltransferase [Chitinophaga sp. CF118]SFE27676.1 Methyltransferase domain-containing protein [Chitinophaga sp. CF118]
MELNDAIQLIQCDQLSQTQISNWADLGCGQGLFTAALSHFLPPGSQIYAVDQKPPVTVKGVKTGVPVTIQRSDFINDPFTFKQLDGIIIANALHYVRNKESFIKKIKDCMKPEGILLVVEYDTDQPVPAWVPYPTSYKTLQQLFESQGYTHINKLQERPSVYGRANIYAALIHR